jgi:ech hydrogenase subunit F
MSDLLQMSKNVIEWVRKKPFCKMYPVVPGRVYDRTRGCVMNDASKCTLCTVCQIKCPTGAIKVDRAGGTWEINHFQCIMCNECVSNCRPKSLTMENKHAAPVAKMEKLSIKVELKKPAPKPVPKAVEAKPAEKPAPKVEAKAAKKPAPKAEAKPAAKPAQKVEKKPAAPKAEKTAPKKKDAK